MTKKIYTLRQKVQTLIANSEYRSVKLHGISCSRADLEMIELYADTLLRQGNINGLMHPSGNVKGVFEKIGLTTPYTF